ncbi:thiamine pyrophosphate-binding protein [Nocardiopsis listeri]|uniref:thiamine pyrophosphate-binding protein n=1 Tax=Nocardiopsis listeri TaxID=53440 RepID=UPI000A46820B|nr:thiamine pyrophosphate-binding protein [Nocardiopsis listeri]
MRPIDAMFRVLREEHVTKVFGNPGTTELPFVDALAQADDIEYVLGVQEASVVAMADGYARATGRPAFVSLHVAAGLANGLVGLLNASRSRTPLVVTAGQQDRRHLVQDPMLSGDLMGLARPAVKHAFAVEHSWELPILLRRAFHLAVQPPSGPVFLSVPMDLLAEEADVDLPARSTVAPRGAARGAVDAARLLADARRPVIVAGDGVGRAGGVGALVELAEALGAAVYHQPFNDGIDFPTSHPLYAGVLAPTNAEIRDTLAAYDTVVVAGCHAFMPHHYTPGPAVPEGMTVVQLDDDGAEIARNFAVDLGLVGEIGATLADVVAEVRVVLDGLPDPGERAAAVAARTAAQRAAVDGEAEALYGPAPMDPLAAAHAVATGLPQDAVVVEEAITTGVRLRRVLRQERPRSFVHTVGGGLGSGIGAAVGTRLGDPLRPVVAMLGDGCTLFGLQGLWSAARYRVPVTFVVMNNGEYRTLKETLDGWGTDAARAGVYTGTDLGPLDFTRAAEFFGVPAVRVAHTDELVAAVAEAAASQEGPLLIEVPVTGHGEGGTK